MNCNQINKNIIGYAEQSIPIYLQEQMTSHLQECQKCRILFEEVKATYSVYDKTIVPEINPFFYTKLQQKLQSGYQTETKMIKLAWKLHPMAASVLIVIGIGMGIMLGNSISGSGITIIKPNRSEVLEAYASDYFVSTSDESLAVLMNNE